MSNIIGRVGFSKFTTTCSNCNNKETTLDEYATTSDDDTLYSYGYDIPAVTTTL